MRALAFAPLLALVLVACRSTSDSVASRTTPQNPDQVYSYCFDEAKKAGDRIVTNGWGLSPEYTRFTNLLDSLSGSILQPTDISVADWFADDYRSITGTAAWVNADSRAAFDSALNDCGRRYDVDFASARAGLEPSPEVRAKTTCVAKAAFAAEAHFGEDSLSYEPNYITYVHDHFDEDDPENYLETEADYGRATNQSPFSHPDSVTEFRASAASC
jgi:hypothetical protein